MASSVPNSDWRFSYRRRSSSMMRRSSSSAAAGGSASAHAATNSAVILVAIITCTLSPILFQRILPAVEPAVSGLDHIDQQAMDFRHAMPSPYDVLSF